MSDRATSRRRRLTVKRSTALLTLVLAFGLVLVPHSAYAQEAPSEEPSQRMAAPTATCSTVAPPWQAKEPNLVGDILDPPTPGPSNWTAIQLAGATRTNTSTLSWQWKTPTSDKQGATYTYGYGLYHGETQRDAGQLASGTVMHQYATADDGHYRFFIWIIESTNGEPQPTGCESYDTERDTTKPVINGNGYSKNGNKATPQLSTDETDVTFDWMVNASVDEVKISDPSQLNPTFTFIKNGTYTFTLTATDSLGNAPTTVVLEITHEMTFTPGTETPVIPVADPAPLDPFVPPQQVLVQTKKAVLDSYNFGATAFDVTEPNVAVKGATTTSDGDPPLQTAAAAPLDSSRDGWVLLGVPWYWWLLGSGGIVAGGLWYRNYFLNNMPTDI